MPSKLFILANIISTPVTSVGLVLFFSCES
jgi:hypothetical protein